MEITDFGPTLFANDMLKGMVIFLNPKEKLEIMGDNMVSEFTLNCQNSGKCFDIIAATFRPFPSSLYISIASSAFSKHNRHLIIFILVYVHQH
jgi:hypothetical protein